MHSIYRFLLFKKKFKILIYSMNGKENIASIINNLKGKILPFFISLRTY